MNENVLIVDDSLTVRMDLADAFSAEGFHALPCSTVAEARAALSRMAVSVCILDVLLPDGNGVDLLREIRASSSATVVVMLSSEADVRGRLRGLQTGADEYVGKPYDSGYLVAKVRELLQARQGATGGTTTTILVIDDSATFREALRTAFESAGYRVLTAPTGEDGLRLAGAQRPDAIVVDGVLPGIDGATVIRHIRLDAVLRDVPCLLLTASADRGAELRALDAGADSFVRKEDELEVILAKLAAMLRRATARAAGDDEIRSLLGPKKILAVDDSVTYLHELNDALKGEGYDVIMARSGEEAIELLAVQAVDCILLDLVMPGMSGYETCQRIKSAPMVRDIPLIMLTALEDRASMIQGLTAGGDDYIQKSSEFEVLRARVRAQIRRKQFEDENRRIREELLRKEIEAAEARAARELAETRGRLVEELERTNKDLEAFSYSVSHDLRAPLRGIHGFSGILKQEFAEQMPVGARELLDRVITCTQRMEQLIEDLLLFSRMGRQPLVKRPVSIATLTREIVDELRQLQPERLIDVRVGELPDGVADESLLKQVLTNLVSNAFKFTRHAGSAVIEINGEHGVHENEYCIRDNGAGFDTQYANRLFGVFQRLHRQDEFEGTGIGLSIVQRVIQRHGGRVWAEAALGQGATFYFTLPN